MPLTPENKQTLTSLVLPSTLTFFPGEALAIKAIDLAIVMIQSQTAEQQKLAWDRWNLLFKPLFDWLEAEQYKASKAPTGEENKPNG